MKRRPKAVERLRSRLAQLGKEKCARPLLMGIVNVTPDSFSDGGLFLDPKAAARHGVMLLNEGADLLDIGAESTRPGHNPVSAEEEWARLAPVLAALAQKDRILSVDTTKAVIARKALKAGACVINDVWGFHADPDMVSVVADSEAFAILMHNRHEVDEKLDLLEDWRRFFDYSLGLAQKAGLPADRLILDPGVGFGKTLQQNVQAIVSIEVLGAEYGLPIMLGVSRKSLFGYLIGRPIGDRLAATLAANLYGMAHGAAVLRVHDVQAHSDALMVNAVLDGCR